MGRLKILLIFIDVKNKLFHFIYFCWEAASRLFNSRVFNVTCFCTVFAGWLQNSIVGNACASSVWLLPAVVCAQDLNGRTSRSKNQSPRSYYVATARPRLGADVDVEQADAGSVLSSARGNIRSLHAQMSHAKHSLHSKIKP